VVGSIPYLPGELKTDYEPLARYLPPIQSGVVQTWLNHHLSPGSWILDPFGVSPRLAIEAAQAGYRVLVAANNPITRFLLDLYSNPPTEDELRAALSELAISPKGDERIESHIRSLYTSECPQCGQNIEVNAFIWEKGGPAPTARIFSCSNCGEEGEHPTNQADVERATQIAESGLHRARAIERITPRTDIDRVHVKEALNVYLPRAIYSLITIINKLDGLNISDSKRKYLQALLLSTCDQANALWKYPLVRERPRKLSIPPRYRENNIWMAFENGVKDWSQISNEFNKKQTSIVSWPDFPDFQGGISVYGSRFINLEDSIQKIQPEAVLAILPRPNQAFWTLSAIWAGWIFGRETLGSFKRVLRRRRFGWSWHTSAISSTLDHLFNSIESGIKVLGLIGEVEPRFITSALVAADHAGFELEDIALREDTSQAQIHWQRREGETSSQPFNYTNEGVAITASTEYLYNRGQPSKYIRMYTSSLSGLLQKHDTPNTDYSRLSENIKLDKDYSAVEMPSASPADVFTNAQRTIKDILSYGQHFTRYSRAAALDSGFWWLPEMGNLSTPLDDRVEEAIVNHLAMNIQYSVKKIDIAICQAFKGLFTPNYEFVRVCLESYGEQEPHGSDQWYIRPEDEPEARQFDLINAIHLLKKLGDHLGYFTNTPNVELDEFVVTWKDVFGGVRFWFYPITSAVISEIILNSNTPPEQSFIVLPGGRANLVAFKIKRDPRLGEMSNITQDDHIGWRYIKFRHLRFLSENPLLTRENFEEQLKLDPLTFSTPQLRLL
jgi:hypothetical protein